MNEYCSFIFKISTAVLADQGVLLTCGSALNGCLGQGANAVADQPTPKIVEALMSTSVVQVILFVYCFS